jgi:hypothetical protein
MSETAMPLERFIQAITSQLDRAQEAMALKARFGMPLTFAVKDLSLDLRAHVDLAGEVVSIRPAGAGDVEASLIHINLTTITRPMIEENTVSVAAGKSDQTIQDALSHEISPEEQRRLEWAGVYTVNQLRDLQRHASAGVIERVASLPAERLRNILRIASQPRIDDVRPRPHRRARARANRRSPALRPP